MNDFLEKPMSKTRHFFVAHRRWSIRAFAALLVLTAWGSVQADDRDLLRERAADPFVFIIFDTSGSMNLTPVCTAEDACEDIEPYDRACTSACTMGDPTCARVCPDFGCIEYTDEDQLPPIEFFFDDTNTTVTTINGGWPFDPGAADPFGGTAITDGNVGKGSKDVTFSVTMPETRRYKVFLHVPQSESWATNVPVTVGGTVHAETVLLDQRYVPPPPDPQDPDAEPPPYEPWKLVGVYEFLAGSTATVRIDTDDTDGPVVVDGIRFLSEVKRCDRMGYRCATPLCPNGDCPPQLSGDDPGSKFFQAKQALYEVLDSIPFVRFGFGSFEQDRPRAFFKHWLYRVRTNNLSTPTPQNLITLPGGTVFPLPGEQDVFGQNGLVDPGSRWECDDIADPDNNRPGCTPSTPAILADSYDRARLHRIPKLGRDRDESVSLFFKETVADTNTYRVTYHPVAATAYGNPTFQAQTVIERCTNADCSNVASPVVGDETIAYDLQSDFFGWDGGARPRFNILRAQDTSVDNSCGGGFDLPASGLDPNDDTQNGGSTNDNDFDVSRGVNIKFLTTADPAGRSNSGNDFVFDVGDIIPFDWLPGADHARDIQKRLAPNTVTDPTAPPDFRVAHYFVDQPQSGDNGRLRLADNDASDGTERPLVPRGSTPLGRSLATFQEWFNDYEDEAKVGGSASDPTIDLDWSCREKFVLMLSDGDETCGGDPCDVAFELSTERVQAGRDPVRTFIVGFGLENRPGNQLQCIASQGGTGRPFFPRNKEELVETLIDIFDEVQAESRSFASASLPAVQSSAADKIFFSSFIPLPTKPFWPGRVDVFREPLLDQVNIFGQPNPLVCRSCDRLDLDSGCHLWNAGHTILSQAPTDTQIDATAPNANLGEARDERRVFYPPAFAPVDQAGTIAQPVPLRLFTLPDLDTPTAADAPIIEDLAQVLVRPSEFDGSQTAVAQLATIRDPIKARYRNLFRVKNDADFADTERCSGTPVGAPASWQRGDYLLGDVFHSSTTVTTGPQNLGFLRQDLCGVGIQPEPNNCVAFDATEQDEAKARGYRSHAARGGWYRRMLAFGANDGQLHFFDAGVRAEIDDQEVFTDGTGTELFAVMPRLVMPIVREQADPVNDRQIFSVDGGITIDDVFIDPEFSNSPDPDEREWRRVLVGGLREAGDRMDDNRGVEGFVPGYYALDVTQPDSLVHPETDTGFVLEEEYIPDPGDLIASGVLPSCLDIDTDGALVGDTSPNCRSVTGTALPFPAYKWEFTDRIYFFDNPLPGGDDESGWYELDEDRNGLHDLANTWSRPLIGGVRVLIGGEETVIWAAIFGGGIDPAEKDPARRGNWLYMVDIETGRTIYKRPLVGAAVADVTGRTDERGLLDALYIGTTAGLMYKVDIRQAGTLSAHDLEPADLLGWPGSSDVTVQRVLDIAWTPFPIFDTQGKPIYQTPALVQVPVLDEVALGFGSGDREDLWNRDAQPGRFFMLLDDDFTLPLSGVPLPPATERDFKTFDFNAPLVGVDSGTGLPLVDPPDFLTDDDVLTNDGLPARRGWIMRFPVDARVTTRASVLAGVTVFTVFQPRFNPATSTEEPCRRIGTSRTFIVDARNGDALTTLKNLRDGNLADDRGLEGGDGAAASGINVSGGPAIAGDCGDRCTVREGFATPPFVSFTGTKNKPGSQASAAQDPLSGAVMQRLIANLKRSFFPPGCQFNDTFSHMIRMQFDNTAVQNLVAVPVGVCPSDWIEGQAGWAE